MTVEKIFKKALNNMLETNEFDKLATYCETKTDVKAIRKFEEGLKKYGAENLPLVPLIMNAPVDVLRDVFIFMQDVEEDDDK